MPLTGVGGRGRQTGVGGIIGVAGAMGSGVEKVLATAGAAGLARAVVEASLWLVVVVLLPGRGVSAPLSVCVGGGPKL